MPVQKSVETLNAPSIIIVSYTNLYKYIYTYICM